MSSLVLSDIGAVQLIIDNSRLYDRLEKISDKPRLLLMQEYADIERKANTGEVDSYGFVELVRRLLDKHDLSHEEIQNIIALPWVGQASEVVKIKKHIHEAGYCVGSFSNVSALGLEILPSRYPEIYETYGGPSFYSCQFRSTKPNTPMYDVVEAWRKEKGFDRVILIDDNLHNIVIGADEPYKWWCILFTQYVDENEPGRLLKTDKVTMTKTKPSIKEAKTTEELIETLREYDIKI